MTMRVFFLFLHVLAAILALGTAMPAFPLPMVWKPGA